MTNEACAGRLTLTTSAEITLDVERDVKDSEDVDFRLLM